MTDKLTAAQRAERDGLDKDYGNLLAQSNAHEIRAKEAEARVAALEGALRAISANNITGDEFVTQGPALALKRLRICAGLADQALAAGGGNG